MTYAGEAFYYVIKALLTFKPVPRYPYPTVHGELYARTAALFVS